MSTRNTRKQHPSPSVQNVICIDGTPVYCSADDLTGYRDQLEATFSDMVTREILDEAPEVTLHAVDEIVMNS